LIGSAVFAGFTSVTERHIDRPTDHATRSVTIGRIYVAMRPINKDNRVRSVRDTDVWLTECDGRKLLTS